MKVRILVSERYDYLQNAINDWLRENKNFKIIDVKYAAGNQYSNDPEYSAMIIYK